ncbi:hypothetical protein [Lentibacter sp.]|uniref:hypothetical protein n=1 Tax=Lentibacter sp. TaxID=2024994 RepID=UPI003F6AD663
MAEETNKAKCAGMIADAAKRSQHSQMKLYFDKIIEVQSASIEHATKANTVNVTVIYAGAFLLLQNTSGTVPAKDWAIIVLLLFISLVTFAIWTVSNSFLVSRQTIKYSQLMIDSNKTIDRKLAELEVLERKASKGQLAHIALWGPVFLTTILTGFFGTIYLLIFYVLNLFAIDFSLVGFILSFLPQSGSSL